jgi:hypothetical protein
MSKKSKSQVSDWAKSSSRTAAALSPTKGKVRGNPYWVIMKGGATNNTRSLADGAYDVSTWGQPGNFVKVHAGKGHYFATAAGTELTLKKAAKVSGRVMGKSFKTGGVLPGREDLGHVTLQRTYPSEDLAYIAMGMLEEHYRRKVEEDFEALHMPHRHLTIFDHVTPRKMYNQAHFCWRLLMVDFNVENPLWTYCPFNVYDQTMDCENESAIQRALVTAAKYLAGLPALMLEAPPVVWALHDAITIINTYHPEGAEAFTDTVMESLQQWPDTLDVSSNGLITPKAAVADETSRVMKAFRQATGRDYISEIPDFPPEETTLDGSVESEKDDEKQPPSTRTAAQRRKMKEVEDVIARRRHAVEEIVGAIQAVDTAVADAINTQDREATRLLDDVLERMSRLPPQPTAKADATRSGRTTSKKNKAGAKGKKNEQTAIGYHAPDTRVQLLIHTLKEKQVADHKCFAALGLSNATVRDLLAKTLDIIDTDTNGSIAMMVAEDDTSAQVSSLSAGVAAAKDRCAKVESRLSDVCGTGVLSDVMRHSNLQSLLRREMQTLLRETKRYRSHGRETLFADIVDIGNGKYCGPNPVTWNAMQLRAHIEAQWAYWQALDPTTRTEDSFFDLHEATKTKLDITTALQTRDSSDEKMSRLLEIHFKSIGVTDEQHQMFLFRAYKSIPTVTSMVPRPKMPHAPTDPTFEVGRDDNDYDTASRTSGRSPLTHHQHHQSPMHGHGGSAASSMASSTDYASSSSYGGREQFGAAGGKAYGTGSGKGGGKAYGTGHGKGSGSSRKRARHES